MNHNLLCIAGTFFFTVSLNGMNTTKYQPLAQEEQKEQPKAEAHPHGIIRSPGLLNEESLLGDIASPPIGLIVIAGCCALCHETFRYIQGRFKKTNPTLVVNKPKKN